MLHTTTTSKPTSLDPAQPVRSPHSKLHALLSLAADEPTVLLPLADAVREATLIIGVENHCENQRSCHRLFCTQQNDTWYAITFLDRETAQAYFARHTSTEDASLNVQLIEHRGLDLLQILCTQTPTLGLEIVSSSADKLVDPSWVEIMARVREAESTAVDNHEYHLVEYDGVISRELRQQLDLFCGQHAHIQQLYICDKVTSDPEPETLLVIVGDRNASSVNIADLIGEVVLRTGLEGWAGEIAWIHTGQTASMERLGLQPVYTQR